MDNRIIIIDGHSLMFRAFYAMQRPMITREGLYTQGIFGFLNMLNKIRTDYASGYIVVTFDKAAPTFRHLEYDEYKAGRKKTPPEMLMQMPLLKEVLAAMNISYVEMDGFEADDLIGTIAKRAEEQGLKPLIITGDRDELQLASENTKILITKKGISEFKIYDADEMMAEYGLTPAQFIDLKGLMGDTSDNIPGIPGVGEKTALKLLHEHGSVEAVIAAAGSMKQSKLKERLEENAQLAMMSRRLATIHTDVPIEISFEDFREQEPDYDALIRIYTKLEFNSFLRKLKLPEKEIEKTETEKFEKRILKDLAPLKELEGEVYLKVLSDGSHVDVPQITGMGIGQGGICYYIGENLVGEAVSILNDKSISFAGHDVKKDLYPLLFCGLERLDVSFDTAVAEYVLDPSRSRYDLKVLAFEYFHQEITDEKEALSGFDQISFLDDNSEGLSEYVCDYLSAVRDIRAVQEERLNQEETMQVFTDIELPLIGVLASMEKEGISADPSILTDIGDGIASGIEKLTEDIYAMAGESFNINSPSQLGTILFEKLGLPAGKKTKKGYSTSADILEKIRDQHDIVPAVLEYRTLTKLKSTYVDGLLPLIGSDGRIHAHFQQTVAATGRLSCTEPNLQNIPIRTEFGRQVRKAFVAGSDATFVGADYSQIELRVLAHLSGDQDLIDAFNKGADIHKNTASKVLGIPENEITPEQRSSAKAVNFGVIYGMSGFGLSSNLNISRKEAETYIREYFAKYPDVKKYMDGQIAFCRENGYVSTFRGRKRYISEITASNFMTRQLGERLAMNSPIQGAAADIIKIAMVKVFYELKRQGLKSRLILQIHDELIIETYDDERETVKKLLKEQMESAVDFKVKLAAEVSEAEDWYSLK